MGEPIDLTQQALNALASSGLGNDSDTNTAIQTALQHGWQEGNKGIQRSHLYCPTHNENQ